MARDLRESCLQPDAVLALGGIIWRGTGSCFEIALIHDNLWRLPQKVLAERDIAIGGKTLAEAAVDAVAGDAGCEVDNEGFAGTVTYRSKDKSTVTLFWHMHRKTEYIAPDREDPAKVEWLTLRDAMLRLGREEERALLREVCGDLLLGMEYRRAGIPARCLLFFGRLFISPQSSRLAGSLRAYRAELEFRFSQNMNEDKNGDLCWFEAASRLLDQAQDLLNRNKLDESWRCFHAARRLAIYGYKPGGLTNEAAAVRGEAEKLSGWRRKTVEKLIGTCEAPKEVPEREEVFQAALILDEHFNNRYYIMQLFKRQLGILTCLLVATVIAISVLIRLEVIPSSGGNREHLFYGILLFGFLGGTLSALLSLGKTGESGTKIPEILSGFWVTMTRLAIGSASAMIVYVAFAAGLFSVQNTRAGNNIYAVYAVSFAAGFSERLILNIVKGVAGEEK